MNFSQVSEKILDCFRSLEGNQSLYVFAPDGEIALNEDQPVSSASIIKLAIMITALKKVDNGELSLDSIIPIELSNKVEGAGVISFLSNDLHWTLSDLIKLMIVSSDNTATNQLIELLGEAEINHTMKCAGAYHSKLMRKMMDREAFKDGRDNLISGKDTYLLLNELVTTHLLSKSLMEWGIAVLMKQQLKDKFPAKIAKLQNNVLAHKTGDLPGVEHDSGILFTSKGPVIYAFLTAGLIENRYGRDAISNAGRLLYDYYM
ncbi:serine hydrolase [Guptibacillus hwajinpoensis]|uniref:Beta-lactamase class A n=1 Tax=Guptibacillus hwajinpoensis TaxID=208199 RepID=A0ABU0K3V5_9BACL|nr:serine hydrolase [Alkalihalobacillus hemicentroti]MDQ0483068.1 beta-lactamase class A [Alkalihalobacillus hemicentroti]